jgi:murein peptide amidase A
VAATDGTYLELQRRWKALRERRTVRLREVACGKPGAALLCIEIGEGRPTIALAAGVHGDEPAGPWALLELVEARALDVRCAYRIWPCLNPAGLIARTRENDKGIDVNRTFGGDGASPEARAVLAYDRDRRFALSLDLHEDSDAQGFYCYEYGGADIGRRAIAALDALGFPIDPLDVTFSLAGPLDDAHCKRERGRVAANDVEEAAILGGLSYSLAIARSGARYALTFETPTTASWESRIAMHGNAVLAAIGAVLEESASAPFN